MTTTAAASTSAGRSTRTAWVIASAQLVNVVWFGVCVWVSLARAAHFAGRPYIPYQGDQYTATVEIWPGG